MAVSHDTVVQLIEICGLTHRKDEILGLALPSVRLKLGKVQNEAEIPIGATKFGGQPDLPPNFEWKLDRYDCYLDFVAQINCADFVGNNSVDLLPKSGILYFFYFDSLLNTTEQLELWDMWTWDVVYFDGDKSTLFRTPCPRIGKYNQVYTPCRVQYETEITIPPFHSITALQELGIQNLSKLEDQDEMTKQYLELSDRLFELTKSTPLHRIVGYPDLVQFDVMVEAESFYHRVDLQELYDSPPSDISNWVLFLQIDSDNAEAKMFWGDGGRLYFIINQDALVNQQFSDVQCIMQC